MSMSPDQMTKLLAELDPCGLIAGGAPRDEYRREAVEILSIPNPSAQQIGDVFGVSFGEPGIVTRDQALWILDEMNARDGGR